MLKIHQTFFLNTLLLFAATLIIASVVSFYALKSIIITYNEDNLKHIIRLTSYELNEHNDLDKYSQNIHDSTKLRVTIVDENGNILVESNTNKDMMENHSNRIEIMEAATNEFGITTRYSTTLKTDFLYIATKLKYNEKPIFLRLSMNLSKIMDDFYRLWGRLAIVFIFVLFSALVISYKMSKKIQYDILQIKNYLLEITNKNYNATVKTKYFSEFLHISILLKELVKKLASRDRKKRKYTAKLRLANRQQTDILSAISHEFKNPIASIIGYTETLREDDKIDIKIRDKFLDKILSNSKKITDMINRLSLSVKLENNDLELTPSSFDLAILCEEIAQNINKKYKDRHIYFTGYGTQIIADKTMLEVVITNLADNALKYSESDVEIKIEDDILKVIDRGVGLEEDELNKITSKFYRVKKNSWDNSMGLGLAIVTFILNLHKINLKIESELHKGSVFSFNISNLLVNNS